MSIIIFYTSLVLLAAMLASKYYSLSIFKHEVFSGMVESNDKHVHRFVGKGRTIAKKIKFRNFHRLAVMITDFTKKEIIYLKRRFDSKQPKFFLASQKPNSGSGSSASFFLRNVSEYKKSIRHDK